MAIQLPKTTKPYRVLSADPPWLFADKGSRISPSHKGKHYDVMTLDDICDMGSEVQRIAADDALLFLWSPHSMVLDGSAHKVATAWGFSPRQEIIWMKTTKAGNPHIGAGHYSRICTEPMLLCRRGKAKVARRDMPNVIFAPRTKHSAKPDESYRYIEKLTACTRLFELFARRKFSPRWDVWGNEV